ncbi:hypothetical protein [Chitinimonas sp.]|uniref:hypothetical protein n=1 Tax=Chitinimonas sp. TaxID=1934313 RepID=UPI002F92357E
MTTPLNTASLADLARWVRVQEGDQEDRLELASAWQRLPPGAPDRLIAKLGAGMAAVIIGLLLLQALLTWSGVVLAVALFALLLVGFLAWHLRGWFWRTVVDVDESRVLLGYSGWGAPASVSLPLDDIQHLAYRMDDGHLTLLALEHRSGSLAIPFSGQRELDKLYCNLLKHLLQKRRPGIGFGKGEGLA